MLLADTSRWCVVWSDNRPYQADLSSASSLPRQKYLKSSLRGAGQQAAGLCWKLLAGDELECGRAGGAGQHCCSEGEWYQMVIKIQRREKIETKSIFACSWFPGMIARQRPTLATLWNWLPLGFWIVGWTKHKWHHLVYDVVMGIFFYCFYSWCTVCV